MSANNRTLAPALEVACMLRIAELQWQGGPTDRHYENVRNFADRIGEKGDIFLYGGGKRGEVAGIFADVVEAVSVGAFLPGGVKLLGMHFEAGDQPNVLLDPQ